MREPPPDSNFGKPDTRPVAPGIRAAFPGVLVLNSDFTRERADQAIRAGEADAIAFGRPFIANPDLPHRLEAGLPFNPLDPATFYSQGPKGCIDYPAADVVSA